MVRDANRCKYVVQAIGVKRLFFFCFFFGGGGGGTGGRGGPNLSLAVN